MKQKTQDEIIITYLCGVLVVAGVCAVKDRLYQRKRRKIAIAKFSHFQETVGNLLAESNRSTQQWVVDRMFENIIKDYDTN